MILQSTEKQYHLLIKLGVKWSFNKENNIWGLEREQNRIKALEIRAY